MISTVLFDLDGTLVDTIELILSCHEYTLARHLPAFRIDRRGLAQGIGQSLSATLIDYAREAGAADAPAVGAAMLETYRTWQRANHDRLIRQVPHMREVLEELRRRGIELGIVTSKVEQVARYSIEHFGLGDLFSFGVFHDDTERHKPAPDPLLEAARRGGFEPRDAAYVGDSIHDIAAGRAAGMKTIGAVWGASGRAELEAAGADAVITDARELLEVVERI